MYHGFGKALDRLFKPRTLITFAMFGTLAYMLINEMNIPAVLSAIVSSLMTHYFDQNMLKNGNNIANGGK